MNRGEESGKEMDSLRLLGGGAEGLCGEDLQ